MRPWIQQPVATVDPAVWLDCRARTCVFALDQRCCAASSLTRLRCGDTMCALKLDARPDVVSEIGRLRVSIGRQAAAVDEALNDHPSACEADYPRWGWAVHKELRRQLVALDEHVDRAPSRARDERDLRAEFGTLLCFAKTLRGDAEAWRAALEGGLREVERKETAERKERERLAAQRQRLVRRRDALQSTIHKTAGHIAQESHGDCRNTLPVFRLAEALTVCSVTVLSLRKRFRPQPDWLVTLNDSREQVCVRRTY